MNAGQQERVAVAMYTEFLCELESGSKSVLTSLSPALESGFVGILSNKIDFNGFLYGVFENDESFLVTSIDAFPDCFSEQTYILQFQGLDESPTIHILTIKETDRGR